jgi:hypothetical protein
MKTLIKISSNNEVLSDGQSEEPTIESNDGLIAESKEKI